MYVWRLFWVVVTCAGSPFDALPSNSFYERHRPWQKPGQNLLALPFKSRVKPLPLGIEDRFVGQFNHNPLWKLSCMLRPHINERVQLVSLLEGMQRDDIFIGLMPAKASHRQFMIDKVACHPTWNNEDSIGFAQNTEYLAQLNDSQSVVSIPGGGFDTLRFWEILGQGSLLLSKRVALQMPEPLVEDKHYLAFDSFEEFKDRLAYLDHPDLVDQIRFDGWSHALAHHTSQARATYLLNLILPREAED